MKKLVFIYLIFGSLALFSQNKKADKILKEGKLLYRLEKASWYGTDDFLVRFKDLTSNIGGYVSYETDGNKVNTVFFDKYINKVIVRYTFDEVPKEIPIKIDTINRVITELEKNLFKIRQDAKNKMIENKDDFFKFYKNTSPNFIPVITKNKKQVFILTGPQKSGIVLIGNDYLLKYNKKNKFKSKEKIHNSILEFKYKSKNKKKPLVSTYHSHIVTDFITSTDICTLLLYKDYIEWKQHTVMSKKWVSIFDLQKENLIILKMKAWKKINNLKK